MSRLLFVLTILPLASCVADVDVIEDEGPVDEAAVLAHPDDDVAGPARGSRGRAAA